MKLRRMSFRLVSILSFFFLLFESLLAHNGKLAYAYPLGTIKVDGDLSDWPKNSLKYMIQTQLSDSRPQSGSDFSGFFQVGYRMDNRSLYIAFTITDNSFIEDVSDTVRFNTQ